ncbi:hypothetical protein Tcan_09586 [Toxocara canis]|uniref:Uncharacterized protein n=1 Tax=Toxocara canis TaxID=6265 RepID=A0A0B2VAG2_TOXCA|nr:hypothetical protein Tcan_09586 [Toxocara canis]
MHSTQFTFPLLLPSSTLLKEVALIAYFTKLNEQDDTRSVTHPSEITFDSLRNISLENWVRAAGTKSKFFYEDDVFLNLRPEVAREETA